MNYLNSYTEKLNGGNISIFNTLYGKNFFIQNKQTERYAQLIYHFKNTFKEEKGFIFSSPGRTEISGNHTDHNHGKVIAGAVNMDNIAVATPAKDIVIYSDGFDAVTFNIEDISINTSDFFTSKALVKGILAKCKHLGYKIGGFHAYINGNVPEGSGLSSSASYEVLIGTIINHLYNKGNIPALEIAQIGQWAENNYFGKPCGLMDQTACAIGGLVSIDFKNPNTPIVTPIPFNFTATNFSLIITDTGGSHANLNDDYAAIPKEMKSVAHFFKKDVLREITRNDLLKNATEIRKKCGDRAFLRAFHFFNENQRVENQIEALKDNDFNHFLQLINQSGFSSFMYNQNIFTPSHVQEQGISIGLALSEMVLKHCGAWRVHGGGIAGTIQAFVPNNKIKEYISTLENTFGKGSCHQLFIRPKGSILLEF